MTKAHSELSDNNGLCERCNRPETKGTVQTQYPVMLSGGLGWGTMWLCQDCSEEKDLESRWVGHSLQSQLVQLFYKYRKEFGTGYNRYSFLDFVVATLFREGDVKVLIEAYENRLKELRKLFKS